MAGKKFQFSLESVLKLRRHETEAARQELSHILRQREEQETEVAQARAELDVVVNQRSTGATGQHALFRREAFRRQAQDRFDQAQRALGHLKEREEDARLQLIERKAAEEALKQLREEEESKYWRAYREAESKFLDEQAISSYQRQRRAANS